ncbi:hypothetical protein UlMin_030469 [Ulmus minor]
MAIEFEYQELVEATESFSPSNLIGKGSHGCVYRGKLKNDKLIAVKKSVVHSDFGNDSNSNSKLQNEVKILSFLPENPHVINLLGTSQESNKNTFGIMVMEIMPNGSLHDLLHLSKSPPPWPKRVEIVLQLAKALHFLHQTTPAVIHRDVKSENILFDSNWVAKLADFGLAIFDSNSVSLGSPSWPSRDSHDSASQPAGTIGYLDPCYTTPCKLSTKNDVFSFGILVLEIISGRRVIDITRTPSDIAEWALPLISKRRVVEICDERVSLPGYMCGAIRHLLCVAASCVSLEGSSRPLIGDVVMGLDGCLVMERVRFPVWIGVLRSLVLMRKRRKVAKRAREIFVRLEDDGGNKGKMLREVLGW